MHAVTTNDVEQAGAGIAWQQVGSGLVILARGIGVAATGGLAGVVIGVIGVFAGAGFAAEIGPADLALDLALSLAPGLAGVGGATIGGGMAS